MSLCARACACMRASVCLTPFYSLPIEEAYPLSNMANTLDRNAPAAPFSNSASNTSATLLSNSLSNTPATPILNSTPNTSATRTDPSVGRTSNIPLMVPHDFILNASRQVDFGSTVGSEVIADSVSTGGHKVFPSTLCQSSANPVFVESKTEASLSPSPLTVSTPIDRKKRSSTSLLFDHRINFQRNDSPTLNHGSPTLNHDADYNENNDIVFNNADFNNSDFNNSDFNNADFNDASSNEFEEKHSSSLETVPAFNNFEALGLAHGFNRLDSHATFQPAYEENEIVSDEDDILGIICALQLFHCCLCTATVNNAL